MNTKEIIEAEDKYFINTFTRQAIVLDHGDGIKVYDIEGKEYLDFFAGIAVNCLGHNHPALVKTIQNQASKLIHISNIYYNEPAVKLAKKLVELSGLDRVFYANSGAEANEGAIKLALKYTGKSEIIVAKNSFHGRTLLTLTATGQSQYKEPYLKNLPSGFKEVPFGDIDAIKNKITNETAAILIEPIQGEGGINIPPKNFFKELSKLCKKNNILLILDEVQTGFGRCGTMFAHELFDIKPDIMTLAKGIGGGLPLGAFLANEEVATGFGPGDHGTTFGGGPLVCAASNTVIDTILNENLLTNSIETGEYFKNELLKLKEKHEIIKDVRGFGLMIGLELTISGSKFTDIMGEKGFLINCTAGNVLRFVPPLIVNKKDVDELIKALDETFSN